jgi:hypothetical protein
MKAVQYSQFGGPEELELVELPDPHPGPGQIRVAVRAVGVNPVDWKMRGGMMGATFRRPRAGRSPALSTSSVTGLRTWRPETRCSVSPRLALAPPSWPCSPTTHRSRRRWISPVPPACPSQSRLPSAHSTCWVSAPVHRAGQWRGERRRQRRRADRHARGARVIGTASPNNHEYLRSLGAEPTTYGEGLVERVRELAPEGVDAALDAAGGGALPALVELAGGPEHVVTIADYAGAQETGARFSGGMGGERAVHALKEIGELIEAGRFSIPVAQTFPLDQVGDAHELSQTGSCPRQARSAHRLSRTSLSDTAGPQRSRFCEPAKALAPSHDDPRRA